MIDHICFEVILLPRSLCRGGGWTEPQATTKFEILSNSSPMSEKHKDDMLSLMIPGSILGFVGILSTLELN